MANTAWHKGVQSAPAPGGTQVALAGNSSVSKSFVGLSDGSPDGPNKSIQEAFQWLYDNNGNDLDFGGHTFNLDDGFYQEEEILIPEGTETYWVWGGNDAFTTNDNMGGGDIDQGDIREGYTVTSPNGVSPNGIYNRVGSNVQVGESFRFKINVTTNTAPNPINMTMSNFGIGNSNKALSIPVGFTGEIEFNFVNEGTVGRQPNVTFSSSGGIIANSIEFDVITMRVALSPSNFTIRGNSKNTIVQAVNVGSGLFSNFGTRIENCKLVDYQFLTRNPSNVGNSITSIIKDCIIDCTNVAEFWVGVSNGITGGGVIAFIGCDFVNVNIRLKVSQLKVFTTCKHFNSPIAIDQGSLPSTYIIEMSDCHLDANSQITIDDRIIEASSFFNYNNFEITPTPIINTDNQSNADLIPQTGNTNITAIQLVGDFNKFEFDIQKTSPLIGLGLNNKTVANFRVGELTDFTGATLNNVTIGATIEFTGDNTFGDALPNWKVLEQIRKSPIVTANGILDGSIVPDSDENNLRPEKYIASINYRETVAGSDENGLFLYGQPMFKDDSGRTTGEDDFDVFDISTTGDMLNNPDLLSSSNLIDVAEIQPFIEVVKKTRTGLRFDNQNDVALASFAADNYPDIINYIASVKFYIEIEDGTPSGTAHLQIFTFLNAGFANQLILNIARVDADTVAVSFQGDFGLTSLNIDYANGDKILIVGNINRATGSIELIVNTPNGQFTSSTGVPITGAATYDRVRVGRDGGGGIDISAQTIQDEILGWDRGSFVTTAECDEIYADGRLSRWIEKNVDLNDAMFLYKWRGTGTTEDDESVNARNFTLSNFVSTVRENY